MGPTGRLANSAAWTDHRKVIEIGNARARQLMADYHIPRQGSTALQPLRGVRPGPSWEGNMRLVRALGSSGQEAAPALRVLALDGRALPAAGSPVSGTYVLRTR